MSADQLILIDRPAEHVARITLNRPEKRNAISTPLRSALLQALARHDRDREVHVTVVRGAGPCFSAGYDLSGGLLDDPPFHTAPGDGQWARHVTEAWFSIWDLAKPVIAQVHGYCLAGGSELATGCDLVYVAGGFALGERHGPQLPLIELLDHVLELVREDLGVVRNRLPVLAAFALGVGAFDVRGNVRRVEFDHRIHQVGSSDQRPVRHHDR